MNLSRPQVSDLRHREQRTVETVRNLEEKISRLTAAHAERVQALARLRSDLARAIVAGPVAPDFHEDH